MCGCDDHTVCPCPRSCLQDEASFRLHSPRSHPSALSWWWRQSLAREDRTEFQHRCLVLGKRSGPHSPRPFLFLCIALSLRGSKCYCSLLGLPHCPLYHNSPRPAPPSWVSNSKTVFQLEWRKLAGEATLFRSKKNIAFPLINCPGLPCRLPPVSLFLTSALWLLKILKIGFSPVPYLENGIHHVVWIQLSILFLECVRSHISAGLRSPWRMVLFTSRY